MIFGGFLLLLFLFVWHFYFMCMDVLSAFTCTMCMPVVCGDHKRVSDPLELQVVVSHLVGDRN